MRSESSFWHPFSNCYDEQDTMLFFDDVFVPQNRVFLLADRQVAFEGFQRLNAWSLYVGQVRFYYRLCTCLAVAALLSDAIGTNGFREIQNKLGELTTYVEMTRLALIAIQKECRRTATGLMAPGSTLGADAFAAQVSPRVTEIIRELGASGLLMQPSEADLVHPELRSFLERYMRGKDMDVEQKSRLFRIAWELTCSSYGMRQELYERWNRGDLVRNRISLYRQYGVTETQRRLWDFISYKRVISEKV